AVAESKIRPPTGFHRPDQFGNAPIALMRSSLARPNGVTPPCCASAGSAHDTASAAVPIMNAAKCRSGRTMVFPSVITPAQLAGADTGNGAGRGLSTVPSDLVPVTHAPAGRPSRSGRV